MIVSISPLHRACVLALVLAAAGIRVPVASAAVERESATVLSCPGDVRAGQVVELLWSSVPSYVEELEILLSMDGGRHYDVRISPEIDPRANVWRWRVPNLPTSEARLRLRLGSRGGESEGAPTRSFAILAARGRPIERRQVHEGRWWDGPDAFERVGPLPSFGAPEESIQSCAREYAAALPPRAPQIAQEWAAGEIAPIAAITDGHTSASDVVRARRFFPLRN